jgi:hypothetical protein
MHIDKKFITAMDLAAAKDASRSIADKQKWSMRQTEPDNELRIHILPKSFSGS